ncbi:transcriptional regulator [Vibrio ishigakensis]|uniref:Transcriptional regulator n=1 Tax=Vibrio ishigakensis TaxID=1481914 RepID=A0A0B8Q8B3_9VIBR|nr:transcriptional regulator [Vibrio ishigakensis]
MQGVLERVPQRLGMSWRYRKIVEEKKSYGWHRHNEYEIAIHRHFKGFCFVGHNQSEIGHNHMVMVGPDLPHAIYSALEHDSPQCETHVIWFRKEWIESLIEICHELAPLKTLLFDASRGLQFSPDTAEKVVAMLDEVMQVSQPKQLSILITILSVLIEDKETIKLANPVAVKDDESRSINDKLERVEGYLLKNFTNDISLKDLAAHLYVSESSVRSCSPNISPRALANISRNCVLIWLVIS